MVLSIKKIKKENQRNKVKRVRNQLFQRTLNVKMKSLNAQLPIVLNISILNVLKNTILKSCLNILIPILCILDVHCTTVMFVE